MQAILRSAVFAGCVAVAAASSLAAEPPARVEFRRAEWEAAPGLTAARPSPGDREVYLHDEVELTNADVASTGSSFPKMASLTRSTSR